MPVLEVKDYPLLDGVDHVQMLVLKQHIPAAAEWYKKHLSFKALIERKDSYYMLSLYKGASLLLHSAPFVFKTKRTIEDVSQQLISAGATILEVQNEVFASFLTFMDPFGYKWIVIREER